MRSQLITYALGLAAIPGVVIAAHSEPKNRTTAATVLSPAAQTGIASVEAEINRIEAETLARARTSLDRSQQIIVLGKLIFYDRRLSSRQNEACAFCHMPETGFTGPVSAINETTVSYPGSIRTRFSGRKP